MINRRRKDVRVRWGKRIATPALQIRNQERRYPWARYLRVCKIFGFSNCLGKIENLWQLNCEAWCPRTLSTEAEFSMLNQPGNGNLLPGWYWRSKHPGNRPRKLQESTLVDTGTHNPRITRFRSGNFSRSAPVMQSSNWRLGREPSVSHTMGLWLGLGHRRLPP